MSLRDWCLKTKPVWADFARSETGVPPVGHGDRSSPGDSPAEGKGAQEPGVRAASTLVRRIMDAWVWHLALWLLFCSLVSQVGGAPASRQWTSTVYRSKATSVKLIRGPYLQCGATNSIVVRWRTDIACPTWVVYGTATNKSEFATDSPGNVTEHVVLLPDLRTDTTYFYSIGCGSNHALIGVGTNSFFKTAPGPDSSQRMRFWVLGDPGTRRLAQFWVRDAYMNFTGQRPTDLWLLLGDNAYNEGRDLEYQDAFFSVYADLLRKSVCWPTYGNHEAYSASSVTQSGVYYDVFTLPTMAQCGGVMSGTEAYYSFDYGNTHFICLNSSDVDRSTKGRMLAWLKNDLAASRRVWTIAFWHHPPYSKGEHDSDKDILSDPRLTEMRMNALPILEGGGVDLVLSGHSHCYERSFLLDGHYGLSSTLTPAMKKDAGDGRLDGSGPYRKLTVGPGPHEGTVYIVAGSSGHVGLGKLDHPAMFFSALSLGSLILDVEGPRLDATFLDDRGGKLDYFTIIKGDWPRTVNSR